MMYDFINNGDFPDGERVPYRLIRWWVLDCYYSYCRHKLHSKNLEKESGYWSTNESEIGYAHEQCENIFRLPIEELMLEVLTLILRAGRGPKQAEPYHRAKIAMILERNDLSEMLKNLPIDELREFEHDLKLLNLLCPTPI